MTFCIAALITAAFAVVGAVLGMAARFLVRRLALDIHCRAPWCEIAAAVPSAIVGWRAATSALPVAWLPTALLLTAIAIPLAVTDLARSRLPNALTKAAYPLLATTIAIASPALLLRALVGGLLFWTAHAVVRTLAPAALGGGDVTLSGSLGLVLGAVGWSALAVAATVAALLTVILAIARRTRSAPHGPSLLAATWLVAVFPGTPLPVAV